MAEPPSLRALRARPAGAVLPPARTVTLRETNLHKLEEGTFDVLVLGGGINGAVSAAALASGGARTALIDRGDFACATSQESSNLAWGGIKYLETLEFGLVRKLCRSRNALIATHPSTVHEVRFFTLRPRGFRHGLWKLLAGAWLYWLMGSFFTKRPRMLSARTIAEEEPIVNPAEFDGGLEYSDAFLHDNDARFVWGFVRSALDNGCIATNYVESLGATLGPDGVWTCRAREVLTRREFDVRARVLVNASGPFADRHNALTKVTTQARHVFSKGIHLIVPRLTPSRRVLTFFADDGRMFFVIPMGPRSVIGTTDTRVEQPETQVTPEDRRFVLDNINKRLRLPKPLTEADVIAERCGVRPLAVTGTGSQADWLQLSRKHIVEVSPGEAHLTIFGGKLTDCVNVGDEVASHVERLGVALPFRDRPWHGEPSADVRDAFLHQARLMDLDRMTQPASAEPLTTRLWRRYGMRAFELLESIRREPSMAEVLIEGAEYIRAEIELTARTEMVTKLDDFLRRRSKIALVMRRSDLETAPGLDEACERFFGEDARAKFDDYFRKKA